MKSLVKAAPLVTVILLVGNLACTASPLQAKYPKASSAFKIIEKYPLLKEALLDERFFERLDANDQAFETSLRDKLALASFRTIGSAQPVRVRILPGTPCDYPMIILDYQTQFEHLWDLPSGPFYGTCVYVGGGRDAMPHRTFYGGTENPAARAEFEEMVKQRAAMPSARRRDMNPKFTELCKKYLPTKPLPEVRSEVKSIMDALVKAFKPYGAEVAADPLGQYGVKITDKLYLYLRDFPAETAGDESSNAGTGPGLRYSHDPFFWLILSGGPKQPPTGYLPAFPGAEGFGAMTTGGRGGKVMYVTNLNSGGTGSLAEALNTKGPRIVLFAVSGQINLPQDVWIGEPDMTLIGYTAPGEGVEVCGRVCMAAGNIIMRGMRFRLRPPLRADGMDTRGDLHNIIFDHCSFAYGSDELLRFIGEGHTFLGYTIQYCLLGPGLGGLGSHPYGPEIGGVGSIHHNILYNTLSRSPEADCLLIDWRNNIMYNLRSGHSRRPESRFNFVDNYVIDRPQSPYRYSFGASTNTFIAGNLRQADGEVAEFRARASDYLTKPYRTMPVTTYDPTKLEELLIPIVGAYLPVRDATDTHFLEGMESRTGKIPFWAETTQGGWRSYDRGSNFDPNTFDPWASGDFPPPQAGAAAPLDSDKDGMPDEWEKANGLNPADPADGPADSDKDGYTNVEEFLYRTNPNQYVDYTDPNNNVDTLH